jgi:uncharacterized protein (TIGR01777 family)
MRILLTGGTGFIGGALIERLLQRGDSVLVYSRDRSHFGSDNIQYINDLSDISKNDYFECFINLAGENMSRGRWNEARKAELIGSRIDSTRAIFELAQRLQRPPRVLLSASAIGYYGHQGDQRLSEDAPPEEGFSHRLCQAWEQEASRFEGLATRVCRLRLGVVLADQGGAMDELTRSFRFGLGCWLGSGSQWLSWIHRDDAIRAMEFLLDDSQVGGVYNLTAPEPVTNRQFCQALCQHLPVLLSVPVPGPILRLAVGEMADELLLNGQRVLPRRLQEAGFVFRYGTLAQALPDLLHRAGPEGGLSS